ncbi:MAG: hypothetical protein HFK08_06860 [Clostridia bacterium]|nr:hypothetical protein [Clostridia bacterium]
MGLIKVFINIKTKPIVSMTTIIEIKSARKIRFFSESVGNKKYNGKKSVQNSMSANNIERNTLLENNFI